MSDQLLHAEDVAAILGVSKDWVYAQVNMGKIPYVRLGRRVRFRRESIDAWIETLEHGPL